ncbi:MAG TPA: tRNA-dihydrouridine synthase [Candidatus Binatia bacterium]
MSPTRSLESIPETNFWRLINRPIVGLSPMDGVTDASFRYITAKHGGPDVIFTEFVNIQAAFHAAHTLIKDLTYCEIERPIVAQIYGRSPELFYKVAHIVCELGFDGLDINMGCPARKVAAAGCGAALIREPGLAITIIRAVKVGIKDWCAGQTLSDIEVEPELIKKIKMANRLRTGTDIALERQPIPVSVKTRLGYDRIVVDDWIATLLEENPAAISLHGRTLQQGYKGDADWGAIARAVKVGEDSETLILGNGDLQDMAQVQRRLRETEVDGVLLGRAAQGNPWIFRAKHQLKHALAEKRQLCIASMPVSLEERFRVISEHSQHHAQQASDENFVGIRKHLTWYCRGFRGAAEMRSQMVRVKTAGEVEQCLKNFIAQSAEAERRSNDRHEGPAAVVTPDRHVIL